MASDQKKVYSMWGLPSEDATPHLKKLMEDLQSEFNAPKFEPHVTVVGAMSLTETEARDMFNKACQGLKAYNATADKVWTVFTNKKVTGVIFFYQIVYLLLHPTHEVMEASKHCCEHFGYPSSRYVPHLSLLYTDDKRLAQQRVYELDESIESLSFRITRLALYTTDTEDKSLMSWEKIAESNLDLS